MERLGSSNCSELAAAVFLITPLCNCPLLDFFLDWCYGTLVLIVNDVKARGAIMSLVRDIEVIVQLFPSQYLMQKPQTASYLEYCC